jgi:phosphoglycerate dehydrogenase-like enzyme
MKPSAVLINVARGDLVDEEALIEALQAARIGGAALDVYSQEPLPLESPLWKLPNVILSPHVAGFSEHYDERATDVFAENLRRFVAGEPLLNLVDRQWDY